MRCCSGRGRSVASTPHGVASSQAAATAADVSLRRLGGRHVHDRGQFARELCTRREASHQTREQRAGAPAPRAGAEFYGPHRLWFMRGCLLSVENVCTQQPTLIKLTIEPQPPSPLFAKRGSFCRGRDLGRFGSWFVLLPTPVRECDVGIREGSEEEHDHAHDVVPA